VACQPKLTRVLSSVSEGWRVAAEGGPERAARWGTKRGPTERSKEAPAAASEGRRVAAEGGPERAARWGTKRGPTERSK
jgi:hypothetical protein